MAAQVRVEGSRDLAKALSDIGGKELDRTLRGVHKRVADVIATRARSMAPVRTGNLRASVRGTGSTRSASVKAGTAKRVPYAAAVIWGRKRGNVGSPPGNHPGKNVIQGDPFLLEAGERYEDEAMETYVREMRQLLARAGEVK